MLGFEIPLDFVSFLSQARKSRPSHILDDLIDLDDFASDKGAMQATLRRAYGCFPSGVTAVCAMGEAGPVGMAASSFTAVSLDPPLIAVCIQKTSSTWPLLRGASAIGVSVLAATHDAACMTLSSRTGDRFAGVDWESTPDGAVLLRGATAWLDCAPENEVDAGDHTIVLLRVRRLVSEAEVDPLVFHASKFRGLTPLAAV